MAKKFAEKFEEAEVVEQKPAPSGGAGFQGDLRTIGDRLRSMYGAGIDTAFGGVNRDWAGVAKVEIPFTVQPKLMAMRRVDMLGTIYEIRCGECGVAMEQGTVNEGLRFEKYVAEKCRKCYMFNKGKVGF